MNDRTRSIEILKQAREILLSRLAERVLDGREDILDDAAGFSYCGAIESLHDQLGQRLGNLTALLAHLQSADDNPAAFDSVPADLLGTVPDVDAVFGVGLEGYAESQTSNHKIAPPTVRDESDCTDALQTLPADWGAAATDWQSATDDPHVAATDSRKSAAAEFAIEPLPPVVEPAPPAKTGETGCHDHVFQHADFRGVDLLAADFEGNLLNSAESGSGDVPAAE